MNIRPMHMIVNNRFVDVFMTMRFTNGFRVTVVVTRVSVRVDMSVRSVLMSMLV